MRCLVVSGSLWHTTHIWLMDGMIFFNLVLMGRRLRRHFQLKSLWLDGMFRDHNEFRGIRPWLEG